MMHKELKMVKRGPNCTWLGPKGRSQSLVPRVLGCPKVGSQSLVPLVLRVGGQGLDPWLGRKVWSQDCD
jgi:hypothetical protein